LESPGLGCWFNGGTCWQWWVVLVGVYSGVLLAGLDCELGSVLQEFLGSTAAESVLACWSWFLGGILGLRWVCAQCVGFSSSGKSGLSIVVRLDCSSRSSFSCLLVDLGLEGGLSLFITSLFAFSD